MTNPNWGLLGQQPNALSMFQMGAQMGTQKRQETEQREQQNALMAMRQKELDARLQSEQAAAVEKANTQRRVGMIDIAKLFRGVTPENYGQRVQVAQQMGLDTSAAPQVYDPNWVQQNAAIIDAFVDKEDQLPGIAQELVQAGYEPGTPQFVEAMRGVINSKYASDYVDGEGNTRRRSALNLGAAQGGPQPGVVEDGYRFKGGNPADPNAWEPAGPQGGQTATPSATFSGGFRGLPGERVTSTKRSAARNRAVGGVANSYHLTGQARDSVPPPGVSMSAYASQLQRLNPHMEVINEGDHVHMEPRG